MVGLDPKEQADSNLSGADMGLYRYLRRKLNTNTQQLRETCESTHEMVDKCLKEICADNGIKSKLEQALLDEQGLKEVGDAISLKLEQSVAGQQQLMAMAESTNDKADQVIQNQLKLKELSDCLSSKADQTLMGQNDLMKTGAAASAKLDQISVGLQQCTNEIEFSRRSKILFSGFHYWEENFYNAIKGTDIEERYDKLVSGMSDKDITIVESMIARIQHFFETGDTTCYLPDESERIYRNRKEDLRIVKLSDHCFVYRNFKLPVNVFETSIM